MRAQEIVVTRVEMPGISPCGPSIGACFVIARYPAGRLERLTWRA